MSRSALVDSNVFIGLIRRRLDPVKELGAWIGDGDLVTCGLVRFEVERGLRTPHLLLHLRGFFNVMISGQSSPKTWERTAQLAWDLDRKGIILPAQDLLIATIALEMGVAVLTDDSHFDEVPGLQVFTPGDELPGWM